MEHLRRIAQAMADDRVLAEDIAMLARLVEVAEALPPLPPLDPDMGVPSYGPPNSACQCIMCRRQRRGYSPLKGLSRW